MAGGSWLDRTGRLLRTVAQLHPAQLAFRPLHVARTALLARSRPLAELVAGDTPIALGAPLLALTGTLSPGLVGLAPELARAHAALDGTLELVGRSLRIAPPLTDFLAVDEPKLIRYQLSYLQVVRSLAIAARVEGEPRREAAALAVAHLREFLARLPPGTGDGWEPYVVATRLLHLLVARELLRPVVTPEDAAFLDGPLLRSLGQHARWVAATLELHLLGNHLFTNGAALLVAGCALDGTLSMGWRTLGHAIVARSLATDLLPDGGHAERSPMYAALYLEQLELVLAATRSAGIDAPAGAALRATALARHLLAIAHPDGDIPLIGDAALDEAPLPADLAGPLGFVDDSLRRRLLGALTKAPAAPPVPRARAHFWDTGLAVVRVDDEALILDGGPLGTADQPGHSHADALSFEFSTRGRRLIVDGGAGHYESDAARAYFRGPLAHSSVSVGGEGPDELWGSFRAGARGAVEPLNFGGVGPFHTLRGAVRAAAGWRHERLVLHCPGRLLAVFDRVSRAVEGSVIESHVHFAPDVEVELGDAEGLVKQGGVTFRIVRLVGSDWLVHRGETSPMRGYSSAKMGRFEPSSEVAIRAVGRGGASGSGWALLQGDGAQLSTAAEGVRLAVDGVAVRVGLDARGLRWEPL